MTPQQGQVGGVENSPPGPTSPPKDGVIESGVLFSLVTDAAGLEAVRAALGGDAPVAIDLETTGLDTRRDRVRLLSLAVPTIDGGVFVYLIDCFAIDPRPLFGALDGCDLIAHNAAFDLGFLLSMSYIGIFLFAQLAFSVMVLKEYLQDLLHQDDLKLIATREIALGAAQKAGASPS